MMPGHTSPSCECSANFTISTPTARTRVSTSATEPTSWSSSSAMWMQFEQKERKRVSIRINMVVSKAAWAWEADSRAVVVVSMVGLVARPVAMAATREKSMEMEAALVVEKQISQALSGVQISLKSTMKLKKCSQHGQHGLRPRGAQLPPARNEKRQSQRHRNKIFLNLVTSP